MKVIPFLFFILSSYSIIAVEDFRDSMFFYDHENEKKELIPGGSQRFIKFISSEYSANVVTEKEDSKEFRFVLSSISNEENLSLLKVTVFINNEISEEVFYHLPDQMSYMKQKTFYIYGHKFLDNNFIKHSIKISSKKSIKRTSFKPIKLKNEKRKFRIKDLIFQDILENDTLTSTPKLKEVIFESDSNFPDILKFKYHLKIN